MKALLISVVQLYKTVVSPFLPSACRFHPTCSEYAMQALEKYGAITGTKMAAYRLLRCQPFSKGGFDPVP
jgi:putative membrane protein insertion efficiency factor